MEKFRNYSFYRKNWYLFGLMEFETNVIGVWGRILEFNTPLDEICEVQHFNNNFFPIFHPAVGPEPQTNIMRHPSPISTGTLPAPARSTGPLVDNLVSQIVLTCIFIEQQPIHALLMLFPIFFRRILGRCHPRTTSLAHGPTGPARSRVQRTVGNFHPDIAWHFPERFQKEQIFPILLWRRTDPGAKMLSDNPAPLILMASRGHGVLIHIIIIHTGPPKNPLIGFMRISIPDNLLLIQG